MIQFDIITIFPEIFDSYFNESIVSRAQKKKLIKIKIHNLRDWSQGRHKQVDDRPYGGGPGMILMVEPIYKALQVITKKQKNKKTRKQRIVMLTPAGKKFNQREAERLAKYDQLILLCGRYEGFDARVDKLVDEKISIGDYVLAGGELPAMVVTEAVARQISGVVGHKHALAEETFSKDLDYIEYPQYTRPEILEIRNPLNAVHSASSSWPRGRGRQKSETRKLSVPKVLLSGNHTEIEKWRIKKAFEETLIRRPDLLK